MPSFPGRFEYLERGRGAVRSGDCHLSFDERTATLVTDGPPLAFDLGDIDAFVSGEYEVRLSLFDGHDLLLTRFAKAFHDMERELREAYRDRLVACLLVSDLDEIARFNGRVQPESSAPRCSGPAEIRLHESNLVVLPDSGVGFQWRLADIDCVEFDEGHYAVRFTRGDDSLTVERLGKRTAELAEGARSRIAALQERSARALHAVFPFVPPNQFSRLAGVMREGVSASIADIGTIHPLVESALLETVVEPGLRPYLASLADRATSPWFAGFNIIRQGTTEDGGDDDRGDADAARVSGQDPELALGAMPADGEDQQGDRVLNVGDGLELLFWFFFPLGGTPGRPTHLAWEATSRGGRATYVFRLAAGRALAESVAAINGGLLAVNFRREPVYLDARRLELEHRYRHYAIALRKLPELVRVRDAFVGRAIHTAPQAWAKQLDGLLRR